MGLSEDEFFKEPPYKFLLKQLNHIRKSERIWEQTRLLVASQYNASGHVKRRVKPKDIIELSFDNKVKRFEYDEEYIRKALEAWKPIKAEA